MKDVRNAVVTGASSGLGAALARGLAARGVRVGLTARRTEALERLAREIREAGGVAATATADAMDVDGTRAAIAALEEALGPIDLMIANAGVALAATADRFEPEAIERMIRVNLLAPAVAFGAVLPGMLRRGRGHLVGMSSLAAYRGLPGGSVYCATKSGLTAMLEGLRAELRGRGVDVTAVHPGFVRTEMTAGSDWPQPFLMDVEPAARIILNGIAARRRVVSFPWPTVALMVLARRLPGPVADVLLARRLRRRGQ